MQPILALLRLIALTLLIAPGFTSVAAEPAYAAHDCDRGSLQMPSPDWRDQIIYFAMIDRFDDGDARNNDQGAGEYDPADGARFSGGDLAGLSRRLDYIRDLGATALWITPPVANQWWDARVGYGGYHGYWAENFEKVDAHFGTLEDYRTLARCLHARKMALVQDIVVNHVGNFFRYDGAVDALDPTRHFAINIDAKPHSAPTQFPFSLNDVRRKADREAAIYHWTPRIVDFSDRNQELNGQLADLDDLNTESPAVRTALRKSYDYWIREVGVDAYRVDTAFYVPPAFFADFLHADEPGAPGILRAARASGRRDFLLFGEGFGLDSPYSEDIARRIDRYMRDETGKPLLPAMINFPLYGSTLDVFARGRPSAVLGHRIRSMMRVHADPHRMPSFVDNHDVERFLASGSEAGLRQALLTIMSLPGIPVIYYGTEQGFREQRAAMFKGGFGANGRDHFDRDAPMYRYIQRLSALRRTHPVLARGRPKVLAENAAGPGALAWSTGEGEQTVLVVLNSADHETLLADFDSGLAAGTRLEPLFAIDGEAEALTAGAHGRLTLRLPARSGTVWRISGYGSSTQQTVAALTLDGPGQRRVDGDLVLSGSAGRLRELRLVVDGNLDSAARVEVGAKGHWQARLDTAEFIDPAIEHTVVAWSGQPTALSKPVRFTVRRTWQERIAVADPADDDHGPRGRYVYPTDPDWTRNRPLDLRGVRIATSGGSLRITLEMRTLMAAWNPANGFDHLAPTLFLEMPSRAGGATVMPLQNARLPEGMRWHYRLRAGGWSNALFGADGASASNEGTPLGPGADLRVDRERNTLTFTLSSAALGRPMSLAGARLHIASWDYDGGYRPLAATADNHRFGGAQSASDPLVMDEIGPITIP
ncbi:alpha-amylase family glycosyl hydrolase [Dokdonella immobilis]|uniref:Glycosidase n=1 Tax=Dokdonella immobilis TaxID=578942 RepID=A0A1I4W8U3_9GAMM|nr:alpha-amylase family glycosyl hydrolase [Dokdonella immobilis]SFN09837.1 Glycosidase [Dokdonella immobilis]